MYSYTNICLLTICIYVTFSDFLQNDDPENYSILVNALVRQLIAFLRRIINDGSDIFDLPPLDPLDLDHFHLVIPAGLIK